MEILGGVMASSSSDALSASGHPITGAEIFSSELIGNNFYELCCSFELWNGCSCCSSEF